MVERFDDPDHGHGNDREVSGPFPEDEDVTYRGQADHDQYALTFDAMHRIGVRVGELWLYYLSMGGNVDEYEVDAYLHGLIRLPALDRDMISQSVNEMIDDICRGPRAPYSANRNKNILSTDADIDLNTDPDSDADPAAVLDAGLDADSNAHLDAYMRAVLEAGGGSEDPAKGEEAFPGVAAGTRTAPKEPLLSVVYSSTATRSFTGADLAGLLTKSRRTNQSCHLTGLLLYRRGRFVQVLEGPEATVRDRMAIITADPRHTRLRVLVEEIRDERQFPDWTMGYEPISPDMSDEVPGYEKTFTDVEDDPDPAGTVLVLRDFIRWFQDRAIPLR